MNTKKQLVDQMVVALQAIKPHIDPETGIHYPGGTKEYRRMFARVAATVALEYAARQLDDPHREAAAQVRRLNAESID